jgi:phenylacetate-CoA ligase
MTSDLHRAFLASLLKTQSAPRPVLDALQDRLLTMLVAHAAREVPFYRDSGRLAPLLRPDGSVDLSRWDEIPVLTRQEARAAGAALHAESVPAVAGATSEGRTSGSTGSPFFFLRSDADRLAATAVTNRSFLWHGVDGGKLAQIKVMRAHDDGDRDAPRRWWKHGERVALDISRRDVDQNDWLLAQAADYLQTYPTNARTIARAIAAGHKPPLRFRAIFTFGETLRPDTRAEIEAQLGPVIDRYAAEELGLIASQCEHGGYHVPDEVVLVEIVDDAGRPLPPGMPGRVLLTALYNYAMPLIRYAIGDVAARAAAPCPCGRHLTRLERIGGRERNMFRLPDGRRVWPYLPFYELTRFFGFRQLQVVQRRVDHVELRYVPEGDREPDLAGLAVFVRHHLHPAMTVGLVAVADIPRLAGGKYEDYVCLLADEPGAAPPK